MNRGLPPPLIGGLTFVAMFLALMVLVVPLLVPVAVLKLLLPVPALRWHFDRWITGLANGLWLSANRLIFDTLHGPRGNVVIDGELDPRQSWLIIANHQSWADILILFDVFRGQVPFPRFFLKRSLIWIPVVGFICWALDMPFMKRNSAAAVARNPALRNQDLETTRRFCEKFLQRPITVVNFLEGTRCTEAKRREKQSPYRHLLRPKSAGFSFTLNAMGEQFAGLIDVTIIYRPTGRGRSKVWSFLCGEQSQARVEILIRPLPHDLLAGNYAEDPGFRERFQRWVNHLWADKDAAIDAALAGRPR